MDFLKDESGNSSSTRLVKVVGSLIIITVWAGVSLYSRSLVDIPTGVQMLFATIYLGSIGQKWIEQQPGPKSSGEPL